jgi:subtilase family serine protease
LNIPDLTTAAVNETGQPIENATLRARIVSRSGATIYTHEQKLNLPASTEVNAFHLDVPAEAANDVVFVRLELLDGSGKLLSDNFYSQATQAATYRGMNDLPETPLTASASATTAGTEVAIRVEIKNTGSTVALSNKLTLRNADGSRVLPAYYSDNYVSLLPGESRAITINAPGAKVKGALNVTFSGWNSAPATVPVSR